MNAQERSSLIGFTLLGLLLFFQTGCGEPPENDDLDQVPSSQRRIESGEKIPVPQREFRAAWVATVDNIDWPSKPGLTRREMEAEAITILDKLVELNMNAVIFQVRPQADAVYRSKLEPWSYFLTGEQGKAPQSKWDPLKFWVEKAHNRGLQLHAWFNPYRANHKTNKGPISKKSIVKTNPELVVQLGDEGYWWMDPSKGEAKRHTIKVVLDVVSRYDIDGVHFDDYFYPYPSYNNNKGFPDDDSYAAYQKNGGKLSRGDWRRHSVNGLIQELSKRIKEEKKHVQFGISPFGIWRPGHPEGISGLDQYNVLYADAKLWLNEGWVDYFMPQLYWPIDQKAQSFPVLLGWWEEQNVKNRHLWPGLKIANSESKEEVKEIVDQIMLVRRRNLRDSGVCLFSMNRLMKKRDPCAEALLEGPWSNSALIPTTDWIDKVPPHRPKLDLVKTPRGTLFLRLKVEEESEVFQFVLNEKKDGKWSQPKIIPGSYRKFPVNTKVEAFAVRSVDRMRNLSATVVLDVK